MLSYDGDQANQELAGILTAYLQSWGLREFQDEATYYAWQQATLPQTDLQVLQALIEQRHGGQNTLADIQFYDWLAKPSLLPVIYSQRFDYFRQIGLLLSPRLSSTRHILDFGCGVGILSCFFAKQYPDAQFVGIDRSAGSIEIAQAEAKKRSLANIQFRVCQERDVSSGDLYDCVLSTHVLFQSEYEPGLPSRNWQTFERENIQSRQEELEWQTGLDRRLEAILNVLSPGGRLFCFEKTWNLGRRIFFQRALNARKLFPIRVPLACAYTELGESKVDGPLYEVSRNMDFEPVIWSEVPYFIEGETMYRCVGERAECMGKELTAGQQLETVSGKLTSYGSWSLRIGVWEDVFAWGLCVTDSGFRGLLLGSVQEKDLVFQIFERVRLLTDRKFEDFLKKEWGDLDDMTGDLSPPGYENHASSATEIYEKLPQKIIQEESTFTEEQGKEMHIEIGMTHRLLYLYWANTFDQRQLVITDRTGAKMLQEYYQESILAAQRPS